MEFQPDTSGPIVSELPFFEDVRAVDGWEGHRSTKTVKRLEAELFSAIGRLNGNVTRVEKGTYPDPKGARQGYRISFVIIRDNGQADNARIDIAALPSETPHLKNSGRKGVTNQEASLRMALYMAREAFEGLWFLGKLSPGLVPLIPFLLLKDDKGNEQTLSEFYAAKGVYSKLIPSRSSEFTEGEVIVINTK